MAMKGLERKKEIILQRELEFANAIGSKVFEKPKVSFWMVLIPILFLHFIYRMQRYKNGRLKFNDEFMVTRRRAMGVAAESVETGSKPDIDRLARGFGLSDALEKPYASWLKVLVDHYGDLLSAEGDSLESLARSAYRGKTEFLLTLNRIHSVEKEFYAALKPALAATEGAEQIIAAMQKESQRLRRELADRAFA
jgi:hypothetical protein